jgi:beta-ribofuranosylaminobenzene 5'-phosphate synthase
MLSSNRTSVVVQAPARIHMTLCDLGRATPRAYGGVGFAIAEPFVRIRIGRGNGRLQLPHSVDEVTVTQITRLSTELSQAAAEAPLDVELQNWPDQHSGFGSKTALLLALIRGAAELFQLRFSIPEMQRLSGRGGTSGVGVHSFFAGGFVWDAGHPQQEVPDLLPSSSRAAEQMPILLRRLHFPEHWRVCLLTPAGARLSGESEERVFRETTPLPELEALTVLAEVAHGVVPAIVQHSLPGLASALRVISSVGFKAREIAHQSPEVRSLLSDLQKSGVAAGLSSLGPTIYVVVDDADVDPAERVEEVAYHHGVEPLWTRGCNYGAKVHTT